MSDVPHAVVQELFLAALERPGAERTAFVDSASGGDDALRSEVLSLLEAATDADDYFVELAARIGTVPEAAAQPVEPAAGRIIDRYRILRTIGHGGMGSVFLAERADAAFDKQVAIKLLPPALGTENMRRRFLVERQILAQLEHPRIARLLDGGFADDGTPFFVMEYVDGEPLDRACDRLGLDLTARLELFLDVCDAVDYAHRNLVVHRDLKPSNILVTGDRQVKLLDFGIAKVLDDEAAGEPAELTRLGGRLLTPNYASPEQVHGGPVTTATDVYALGVLLYDLVCGDLPFRADGLTAGEIERRLTEHEPAPPSTRVGDGVASQRGTTPGRLRRHLRGDLDTIVLMALRREPERRYPAARQLADDIRRYLAGLPVEARRDTRLYRAAKLVRRRPAPIAAVLAAVIAGILYVGTVVAHAERLEEERNRAQAEAATAERVTAYLVDLFQAADPIGSRESLTLREVLDRASDRVHEELTDDPPVQARLMATFGEVYRRLGDLDIAEDLITRSLQVHRSHFGDDHVAVASSLRNLGSLFTDRGDYPAAVRAHREALDLKRQGLGNGHGNTTATMQNLANALQAAGELDEAERLYREAAAIHRAHGPEAEHVLASNLSSLGHLMASRRDFVAADSLLLEALEIRRRILGNDHPRTAITLNNLASARRTAGDFAGSLPLYRESLEIRRSTLGDDHPAVAIALNNLALSLEGLERYDEAERLFRESLDRRRRHYQEGHPSVAAGRHNLAGLLARTGRTAEAEPLYRMALSAWENSLAPDHPNLARGRTRLGLLLLDAGRYAEADQLLGLARATHVARSESPDDDPLVAAAYHYHGTALARMGTAGADSLLNRALEIRTRTLGAEHEDTRQTGAELETLRSTSQGR